MSPLDRFTWMIRDSRAGDIDAILDIWLSASIQAHDNKGS